MSRRYKIFGIENFEFNLEFILVAYLIVKPKLEVNFLIGRFQSLIIESVTSYKIEIS